MKMRITSYPLLILMMKNIKTATTTANNTAKIIMAIRLPEIKQNKI